MDGASYRCGRQPGAVCGVGRHQLDSVISRRGGGRLIAACGAVPRTHAGSCRHSCGVCARRRRSGSPHHRRLRRRVRLRASGNGIRVILEVAQMLRGEGHGPLPKPDQAVSLAFVPWNALQGNAGAVAASEGIAGLAYVGLRGSERIVTLLWDGKRLTRLDEPDVPGWRGRGIDCAGSRLRAGWLAVRLAVCRVGLRRLLLSICGLSVRVAGELSICGCGSSVLRRRGIRLGWIIGVRRAVGRRILRRGRTIVGIGH